MFFSLEVSYLKKMWGIYAGVMMVALLLFRFPDVLFYFCGTLGIYIQIVCIQTAQYNLRGSAAHCVCNFLYFPS
jgi:hypothetical protein